LAELAAEQSIRSLIEEKLARYLSLTDEMLAVTGADRMPPPPLHVVAQ
jgi:hypothetical protein